MLRMKPGRENEERIEEVLKSLDGITRASAPPFFYTRLQSRLYRESRSVWDRIGTFIARPLVFAALIGLVLATNFFAVYQQEQKSQQAAIPSATEEYAAGMITYYEAEISEP